MARSFSVVIALAVVTCLLGGCSGGGGGGGNNGVIAFTASNYSINEDGTVLDVITVTRTGGTGDVSVTVTLTNGTATAPADYDSVAVPMVLEWLGGDTTDKMFTVTIVDDHDDEADETVNMTLGNPTGGAVIGNPGSATLTIIDDDVAGTVQFDASAYTYGEDGTALMPINVTRTGGMDGEITVTVTSTDGTANSNPASMVEPQDYSPLSVVVTFADQSTTPTVTPVPINIVQDVLPELDETFTVTLTNPTNGAVLGSPSSATVTITDDDDMLELQGIQINEFFGSVVAKLGPKLIVGAPGLENGAGGFATVTFNGPSTTTTYFHAPPFGDGVGRALSVNGLDVLVGALSNVYLYQNPVLGNASPAFSVLNALDGFGSAVYLNSTRIIVGAPHANGDAGAVLVYDEMGAFQAQVDGRAGELFGTALAPAGANFAVGAPGNEGSVQFFGVGTGTLNLVLDNPFPGGGPGGPAYGQSIAVSEANALIFVGAPNEDTLAMNDGRVYRYDGLTINSLLPPGAPIANGRFGANVLVTSTGVLLVQQQGGGASATGQVHAYDLAGNLLMTYDPPSPAPTGNFGASMCEFDGAVVIGAPRIPALVQQGRVFMFRLPVVP